MNNEFLHKVNHNLENLDRSEWTKVTYDPKLFTLVFHQRGRRVDLHSARGLIKAKSRVALLTPADLTDLITDLDYLIQYPDAALLSPTDFGYKVYIADLKIYDRPRLLTHLKFYSIKNRFYLGILKLFNPRIRRLMSM